MTRKEIALFEYPNALNFDEWGIFIPQMEIPEHLVDRFKYLLKGDLPGWILEHPLDLLTYFGTPLGQAVEGYDEYLVGDFYPDDHPKAGDPRFNPGALHFDQIYIFPNGWRLGVESNSEEWAYIALIQDGNPQPALYAPDWWPEEEPTKPADLFELVFNAPKSEEVVE